MGERKLYMVLAWTWRVVQSHILSATTTSTSTYTFLQHALSPLLLTSTGILSLFSITLESLHSPTHSLTRHHILQHAFVQRYRSCHRHNVHCHQCGVSEQHPTFNFQRNGVSVYANQSSLALDEGHISGRNRAKDHESLTHLAGPTHQSRHAGFRLSMSPSQAPQSPRPF